MYSIIKKRSVGIAFALIFIIAGVFFYNIGTKPYANSAFKANKWPTTQGIISCSEIDTLVSLNGKNSYCHNFIYKYKIDNKEYIGTKIKLNSKFSQSSIKLFINQKIKKYQSGSALSIYYNPEKPEESYLKPASNFIIIIIKYLPLIISIPLSCLMLFSQTRTVLKSFKSEY